MTLPNGVPVAAPVPSTRSKDVQVLEQVPPAPDYERHVLMNTPLDHIWKFINPVMLYGRHLGLRTSSRALGTPAEAELAKTEEGRKALYAVSGSSFGIVGMPEDEARDLLDELAAHATQVGRHLVRRLVVEVEL